MLILGFEKAEADAVHFRIWIHVGSVKETILIFFEKEMFSSIFEQTLSESQLAKFASRMLAMDAAGEKVRQGLLVAKSENLKLTHKIGNKKQLESLSSIVAGRRFA